jgi:hypothetical protein
LPAGAWSDLPDAHDSGGAVTLVLHQHPFASYRQKALIALYELDLP